MERPTIVENGAGAENATYKATITHVAPENRWLKLFVQSNYDVIRHIEDYLEGLEPTLSTKPGFMHQSQIALGTPCFARCSNKWYRAVVSSWPCHNETLVEVTFIDYGNCEEVSVGDVRQSPDPIFRTPHAVSECFLDELDLSFITPQGAEELVLLAKNTLSSAEVTVAVRRLGQVQVNCVRPIVSVTLPDGRSLADMLVRSSAFANAMAQTAVRSAFLLPALKLGVPYEVYVSHVEAMDSLYVHLATREPSEFTGMIQDAYANVAPLDPSLVHKDTVCLARFTEDSQLYRSLVVDCCQGACKVAFVDYGNHELKPASELFVIPPELLEEPAFAIHCDATSTGLDKDTFLEVTADQKLTCVFLQGVRHGVYVVMFDGLNGSKVTAPTANCVSYNGLPGYVPPTSTSYIQIQQLRLDPGCRHVMYVTYIESTEIFYAQLKEMADDIEQISTQLEAESSSLALLSPADIVPGLAVACRYEGTWYRAVVVQPGPQVQVWIADYGDTTVLDISELRQLDVKYTLLPAYATKLTLDGFTCTPQFSEDLTSLLHSLLLDVEANVSIVDVRPDGTHAVHIFVGDPPKSVVKALSEKLESSRQGVTAKVQLPTVCPVEKLVVMSITPPRKFFGQFVKVSGEELDALQKALGDHYSKSFPDPAFMPMPGDHVCCRFSEDGQFYRAKIERVFGNGSQYDVFYLDYGNEETVLLQDLRALKPEFAVAPLFGIPCQLQSGEVSEDMVDTEVEVRFLACHGDVHTVAFTTHRQNLPQRDLPAVVAPAQASAPANMNTFGGGEALALGLMQLQLNPGCQERGTVVVVKSPSEFYCQLSKNDDQLNGVAEMLGSVTGMQPSLPPAMRKVGSACCALYSDDGGWYRGIIRELHPGGAAVFFVDYGNVESVANEGLKLLPDALMSVPCQAVGCKLNAAVAVDTTAATARLDEILADQEVTIWVHRCDYNKVHDVDVILPNDVNVRDLLAQEGLLQLPGSSAFPPQPPSVPASVPQPPSMQATPLQMSSPQLYHMGGFSYPALTDGVSVPVEVCWVLTPGDVFVQLKETQDVLEQLMSEMQAYYATFGDTVSNDIRPGQACVALYSEDQQWYRARVVHAKAGMLGVQYVDYGNCEEIPEGSVHQILTEYAELPAQAIRCRVRSVAPPSGLSTWPILKDQTPLQQIFDGVFLCRPVAQKDGVHLVDLERQGGGPSLVESLVAAGLAADATAMPRELGSASEASQKQPLRAVVSPAEFVFHPKQFFDVKVTAVVSSSEVWCCFVESVEPMAKALQEAGDVAPKFRNPVPGEACVARLPSKDEGAEGDAVLTPWARAVVKSRPSPAKLELFFVDVGGTRVVHHSEVKQILPELTTQPGCAFQCVLNCSFPVDATELSAKILYKELVLQVEQQLEPAKVVGSLFDTSGDSEVNVLDSFAPPPQEEASPPPLVYTPAPETASALQGCSAPEKTPISENVAALEEAPIPEDISASEEAPIPDVSAPEEQVQESQPPVEAVVVADTAPPSVEPVAPEPKVTSSAAKRGPPPTRTSPPANTSRPPSRRGSSNRTIVPCYPPLSKISGKMAAYVMHAEDISCFYVMRKEQEEALEELSMRLDAHYTKNPEPVVAPLPRLPCVIFYPQDEAWYRARVAGDSSCVQLVDYGNTDIVPEVREIAAEFLEVPPFCYKCKLDGAIDFAGIPGVFGAFKEMVEGSELELEVMAWGPEVTVRLAKEGQDITTILKSRFLSSEPVALKTDAQQKPVVFSEATPSSEPPAAVKERKACTVSHVDSLNSFYVQYSTQRDSLPDFVDKLQVVLASTPQTIVETPDSSTLYAALYSADNLWYRARVEGPAEEGGFRVRFVDYGNVETVNSVVSLCSEELLVEPFCVECQLADVKGADGSNVLEKFMDLVLDSGLFVETVKSGTPMSVQLFTRDGINLMSKLPLQRRYRSPEVPLHQKALVSIMHIESPTDFFVHFNDRQGALETLTQELQEVPENENTSVDLSQPCMAYWFDDLPYRITVLKDKGEAEGASSVPVKFVDYGNTDTVEQAGIRELPDALLSEPLFAINCTLDVPEDKLGVEALDKLKVLADEGPTSSLLAEFLGERNGRYVVRLLDMGIDILEKLQGAVHDASRGGSSDVTANSQNESVFKEGTSEGPESVPKAPIVEGENKQNDQVSTDPFSDSVSVSEPLQFSEIEACQGMSDKETGGLFVEAESQEQEGPSDGAPNETPENLQSSEELPKEDTLSEPECNDSSLRVDNDENVAGEPEPLCSAVGGSTELYEAAVLPEGVGVGGAALLAVLNADMLSKVPQFGEKDLSALSDASPRYKEKGDAEAFEGPLSKSKREAEIFENALSEEIATDETKGTSHTAATELIADLHKGTPVKLENAISSLSTASVSDKQSTLAGSGDTHITETVSSEAHLEKPLKNMDTPASKVGLALKESVTLPSSRLASKDDRSAMGAATVPKATALNIGAGGDGRQTIVPNGTSSADSTPFTRRRFRRRLSLDDCPIPGACTNAELLEIQSSDNVN